MYSLERLIPKRTSIKIVELRADPIIALVFKVKNQLIRGRALSSAAFKHRTRNARAEKAELVNDSNNRKQG